MKASQRIALALGIVMALLCAGCYRVPWPFARVLKDDWTLFSGTDWRVPAPEPPPSATATEAAHDLLPYRDRIIAAFTIAERPENQKTGGWPKEDSPEAIASGIANARLQTIASVGPIYRLPPAERSAGPSRPAKGRRPQASSYISTPRL